MSHLNFRAFAFWVCVTCTVLIPASVRACSVPVFRYALERWASDPYQAVVFHRGPMSEAQQAAVKNLTDDGLAGQIHSNVSLRTVDLDQNPGPEFLALSEQLKVTTLPWVVVRHPDATNVPVSLWSGPLAESGIKQVLDSPVRKEIVRRLASGESVVWTLLEVGDPQKDDEAAKLLESRLAYLTTVLKLPKLDQQDVVGDAGEQLRLAFSVVRLSRKDAEEQAFVKMLLGSEPGLDDIAEPMAFPIFGRGRVLYALAGKGINHEHIDQASTFLIGACSCQVKEQNPGVDLLVSADWEHLIVPTLSPNLDSQTVASLPGDSASGSVDVKSGAARTSPAESSAAVEVVSFRPPEKAAPAPTPPGNAILIGGLVVAGLAGASFLLRRKT